ncbi:MAG: response regulator [Nitrosospira sp.]
MSKPHQATATILIASDNVTDAELIKKLLEAEFDNVFVSTAPDRVVEEYELRRPNVLVLAFDALEKSERYYTELRKIGDKTRLQAHRTIILCDKNDIGRVYLLCKMEHFHDYVFFWPMTYDAPRLLMSVHLALRELAALGASPTVAEFAVQAQRLAELETFLHTHETQGSQQIEVANTLIEQAEQKIGAALDSLSRRLGQGRQSDSSEVMHVEIDRFKREEIEPRFRAVSEFAQPLKIWMNGFRQKCIPHIETARALNAMADRVNPTILIVDDDDFQRTIVGKTLEAKNYRLLFADSGLKALELLHNRRPDLILMDVMMPDISGIETTRRLKAMPRLANVPVVMMTGKSVGDVVIESLQAGATDFVVKPIDRETLVGKVTDILRTININRALARKKWDDI